MVTEEFIVELGKVCQDFIWKLQPQIVRGAERRAKSRFDLRAFAKRGPAQDIALGPIGVVCYATTRTLYEPDYWVDAAKELGLVYICASEITAAASDRTWKGREGERRPDERLEALRIELIETVGLPVPLTPR
jgi:hypothetical protein